MGGLRIIGLGRATGDVTVTNEDMSRRVETSDAWIREKTGIRSRYFAENKSNADMAVEAAEMAIEDAGIDRRDIGYLMLCTFTPDRLTPSVACSVAGKLGLREEIMAVDLNGACSGFLMGCRMAEGMMAEGMMAEGFTANPGMESEAGNGARQKTYALVIGSERISQVLNMEDRGTCVLFGDGAGAAVMEYNPCGRSAFYGGCQPNDQVLGCDRNGFIQMSGQEVYRFAVSTVPDCLKQVMARAELTADEIDWFVCHQANERIIDNAARRLRGQEHKFYKNLYWYGNTSAASVPLALCDMKQEGLFQRGADGEVAGGTAGEATGWAAGGTDTDSVKVVCAGFGAGLTYAGMLLEIRV